MENEMPYIKDDKDRYHFLDILAGAQERCSREETVGSKMDELDEKFKVQTFPKYLCGCFARQ